MPGRLMNFFHFRRIEAEYLVNLVVVLLLLCMPAKTVNPAYQKSETIDIDHIISEFTSGETTFLQEFSHYGYKLEFVVQSIRENKVVDEYFRESQVLLNENGKIEHKVLKFVPPRSTGIRVTKEDLDNLSGPYQFALQSSNSDEYSFAYVGKEHLGNLDLYVFDVAPKSLSSKRRLFHGRIWVGVDSLRIVKTSGKFEQKGDQKFPIIETYRDTVSDRFLFPAGAFGDDELVFDNGAKLHLRLSGRYREYVKLN